MAETWQVIDDEGTAHDVAVDEGRGAARSWWAATPDVARRSHASARDAVVLVAQACEWAVVEVLAPGVETRASEVAHLEARRGALLAEVDRLRAEIATARAEGAREMREAAVKHATERAAELDASVTEEEAADDEGGYGRFCEALLFAESLAALPLPGGAQ
jgi:hypothetical protein